MSYFINYSKQTLLIIKKQKNMKVSLKKLFIAIIIATNTLVSCNQESTNDTLTAQQHTMIESFESNLIKKMKPQTRADSDNNILLIGYTTLEYNSKEWQYIKYLLRHDDGIDRENICVLDSSIRLYYPLRDAIIQYSNNVCYCADENGLIGSKSGKVDLSEIILVGRRKTEKSIETKLYASISPTNYYKDNMAIVYDLGVRYRSCSDKGRIVVLRTTEEGEGTRVLCTNNHKPFKNCTHAYPEVAQGRCTTFYDRCMDYNGINTDCQDTITNFNGSDCYHAMLKGHCWNEIGMNQFVSYIQSLLP